MVWIAIVNVVVFLATLNLFLWLRYAEQRKKDIDEWRHNTGDDDR